MCKNSNSEFKSWGGPAMRCKSALKSAAIGIVATSALATTLWAQEGGAAAPWRGAGEKPCFGPEGGTFQCPPTGGVVAVRAGRVLDTLSGQVLTNQVLVLQGDRISEIGPAAQVKVPADAQVIDLGQAMVLPGLIDAHTHMFNTPKAGMSRESSTLIAIHNLQADRGPGSTQRAARARPPTATAMARFAIPSIAARLTAPAFRVRD